MKNFIKMQLTQIRQGGIAVLFRKMKAILNSFLRLILSILSRKLQRICATIMSNYNSKRKPNLDVIVIVTHRVHVRACKIAYGLKICNYKVVLLHSDPGFCNFDSAVSSLFDVVLMYNSPEDAVSKATRFRPIAYNILCNWDYRVAMTFVKMRPGIVVVDTLDVLGGLVRPQILNLLQEKNERFCFENADGICCRDLRTQYLKQKLGYRLSPRLFWPDYCWPVGFTKSYDKLKGEKHVVYAGNIEINPSSPVAYQYDLARLLAHTGINFHIYPSVQSQAVELRNEIRNLVSSDLMKYVHIHDTLSFLDLASELSTFHAGILISTKNVNYGNDHDTYYGFMEEYFLAAKIFDYHEAGLLCLTQNMRMLRYIFPNNKFYREVHSLAEIVEIVSKMEIREIEVEPKLRLDYHAHRLSEFYLRLYNQKFKRTGS
ncbi:MAG: hypothetical protein NTY07_16110 [Bacteroidia bacterium]|nr:hypothetical protein [Bacteroidia bacterium]